MQRYVFVILGTVVGCSSGEGALITGGSDCDSMRAQICARWVTESDAGKPCDPPQITSTTDYRAVCERADEKCSFPASTLSCPAD